MKRLALGVLSALLACRNSPLPPSPAAASSSGGAAPSPSSQALAPRSTQELKLGAGDRIVATSTGARPTLFREKDRVRVALGSAGPQGPLAFDLTGSAERSPLFSGGGLALERDVVVVPLLVRTTKAWFSVLDAAPDSEGTVRARLVERDAAGRARVIEQTELRPGEERTSSSYDRAGRMAVVSLGPSVYAFTRHALVLDGPGADRAKFEPREDAHCPPQKRCFPIPPTYDLSQLVGVAPDGSFVIADRGVILRVASNAVQSFRYETLARHGAAGNLHVTLVHGGEPPEVIRWSPPPATTASESAETLGARTVLARGSFEALTEDERGDVYGISEDGALVRMTGPGAGPVYTPEPGCRTTSALAFGAGSVAWVVSCSKPGAPTRHVVVTR